MHRRSVDIHIERSKRRPTTLPIHDDYDRVHSDLDDDGRLATDDDEDT